MGQPYRAEGWHSRESCCLEACAGLTLSEVRAHLTHIWSLGISRATRFHSWLTLAPFCPLRPHFQRDPASMLKTCSLINQALH